MSCQIEQAIELLKIEKPVVYKSIQAAIEKYASVVLGSEEYGQLGDRGKGNDVAYMQTTTIPVSSMYPDGKADIKYGEGKKTYRATVSKIEKAGNTLYVTIGKDRFEFNVKAPIQNVSYYKSNNGSKSKNVTHVYIDIKSILIQLTSAQQSEEGQAPTAEEKYLRSGVLDTTDGIVNLFNELADVGNVGKEYRALMEGLLKKIDPAFLPNLKVYINKVAEKNKGAIDGKSIIVDSSVRELSYANEMSGAEVYAHEMVHAISKFAIESARENTEAYNVIRQIQSLRDKAKDIITVEMMLPTVVVDEVAEREIAEKRLDYIFNSKYGLHEFIAHALTNPKFIEALEGITVGNDVRGAEGFLEKLKGLWENLVDIVLGENSFKNVGKNYHEAMVQLTFDLAKFNNRAVVRLERANNIGTRLIKAIDDVGNKPIEELFNKIADKLAEAEVTLPPKNASKLEYRVWAIKFLAKALLRKDLEGVREQALSALGLSPDGAIMGIVRDLEDADGLDRILEQLGMDNAQIDRTRELTVDSVHQMVQEKFKVTPTELQEEMLTAIVVDTDLSTVFDEYGVTVIEEIMSNSKALDKKIEEELKVLEELNPEHIGWFKIQAKGLGHYLATGHAGIAQYLNAGNIAREVGTVNKDVVQIIDKLATLYAIKESPKVVREEFSSMLLKEEAGVSYLVELQAATKREGERVFETSTNMIKGYSKELFDDSLDLRVRPTSMQKEMASEGYVLEEVLKKDPNDSNAMEMGLFISKTSISYSYNQHAMRMTDMGKRGTSLSDVDGMLDERKPKLVAARDIANLRKKRSEVISKMKSGVYVEEENSSLNPVMNDAGAIVDFRYMMGKFAKKTYLKQDTRIIEVLGRTLASVQDKIDTEVQNEAVLAIAQADMAENYTDGFTIGKNKKTYIKIEKNSPNKKVVEIYKVLPHHLKEAIKNSEKGYIAIRQDMMHNYFGFRDASIMDIQFLDKFTPQMIARVIRLAEKLWQEIVKISKVDIVIRTPMVFIGNVVSNFMYSVINGTSPAEVFRLQVASFRNLTQYLKVEKELDRLSIEGKLGKRDDKTIARLEYEQTLNPVHELMEAGMYQAIVEDLGKREFKSSSKLARGIDEKTKEMPEWVKNGAHWLYLSEKTSLFQAMTKATQMSDFVARATEYELLKRRGVKSEDARKTVLDAFVNYTKPSSSLEEYFNNMGLFMFTKYAKRIQRAIRVSGKKKFVNVMLSVIGQEFFFEVDDIYDQSVLTRSWANLDQDMFQHVKRVMYPTTLEFVFSE